jgi:hypothetical protein
MVGLNHDRWRECEPKSLCRLDVDDELDFGRLLHGEVARLRALEDFVHVARCSEIKIRIADAILSGSAFVLDLEAP